jgi:hypothetical protein
MTGIMDITLRSLQDSNSNVAVRAIWFISNIDLSLPSISRHGYYRYCRATGYVNYFNRVSNELQKWYNYLQTINNSNYKCVKRLHKPNSTFLSKIEHVISKVCFSTYIFRSFHHGAICRQHFLSVYKGVSDENYTSQTIKLFARGVNVNGFISWWNYWIQTAQVAWLA